MKILLAIIITVILSQSSYSQIKSIDSESLVKMMEGSFSSRQQSESDSDYYDIRLHMKRIWSDRDDGKWLYVEQSTAQSPEKPYRQRVYRITNTFEGRFESSVFIINDPLRFAGDWKKDYPLTGLTPDSLNLKEGCSVILTLMNDNSYEGSTEGSNCESDLNGAKYATSEVRIDAGKIISWDRGFDAEGKQVWGAEKGGYVFLRVED